MEEVSYIAVRELLREIAKYFADKDNVSTEIKDLTQKMAKNRECAKIIQLDYKGYEELKRYFESYKEGKSVIRQGLFFQQIRRLYNNYELVKTAVEKNIKNAETIYMEKANKRIMELEKLLHDNLNKSKEMLGEQAGNTNAKKYLDYADANSTSAGCLFWVSIIIMAAEAIMATSLLWNIENIDTTKLWLRIPLGFLILLPAFFMMRESKKLKDKEFQYTDMAYRIMTSEPYIDSLNLPPEEKAKLKAALVKDFFARPIECRDDGGLPPIDNICEVIKTCLDKKD